MVHSATSQTLHLQKYSVQIDHLNKSIQALMCTTGSEISPKRSRPSHKVEASVLNPLANIPWSLSFLKGNILKFSHTKKKYSRCDDSCFIVVRTWNTHFRPRLDSIPHEWLKQEHDNKIETRSSLKSCAQIRGLCFCVFVVVSWIIF